MAFLTRYEPARDMLSLRDAMDRLFQESFVVPQAAGFRNGSAPLDLHETADSYVATVSLPGWRPEEINITVQDNTVTISGERGQEPAEEDGKTYHVRERRRTAFSRSFSLPMSMDADKATANYENGELILTLPKAESAKPRQIKVGSTANKLGSSTK